uniref:DNA mismatch repair protein n=1 Tax=virus sp. ct1Hk25 TaxID=2825803 RepID=A0A8S5RN62_9VIRU|nr:MAG TPA: DNA mismatch repair protein [virus sp. ct1Hk25]
MHLMNCLDSLVALWYTKYNTFIKVGDFYEL